MAPVPELALAERSGLPDEIAYLRAAHPSADWRRHGNFGRLTAFWLQIHDSLRSHGGQLQEITKAFQAGQGDPAAFQRAFTPRLNHFLQHLHAHHQIEDTAYFPKFRALDLRMVAGFDLLENDHGLIHGALLSSVESARRLLSALASADGDAGRYATDAYAADQDRLLKLLHRHLADEEDLVVPAMLEHGEGAIG